MSNFLKLNLKDVSGAVVSAVIMAVLAYLGTLTNVMEASPQVILNVAVLTAITSLTKSLSTTKEGNFAGVVKVK